MDTIMLCKKCSRAFQLLGLLEHGLPVDCFVVCPYEDCHTAMEVTSRPQVRLSATKLPDRHYAEGPRH